jgi:hypothetical protein
MAKYKTLLMKMVLDSPTNQQAKQKLWTFVALIDLVGTRLYFATTKISTCFNQICTNVGCVCVGPCDYYQGLLRWFV